MFKEGLLLCWKGGAWRSCYTLYIPPNVQGRVWIRRPVGEYQCKVHVSINVRLASMQSSRVVQVHSRLQFDRGSGQGVDSPLRWLIAGSKMEGNGSGQGSHSTLPWSRPRFGQGLDARVPCSDSEGGNGSGTNFICLNVLIN